MSTASLSSFTATALPGGFPPWIQNAAVGLTPARTWVALPWPRGPGVRNVGYVLVPLSAAVIAAIFYGTGAALQQHQASTAPDGSAGRPSLLLLLMRRPWWLLGIATEEAGFAAHAVALRSGPLTVVQMLMASSLVFSVATVRLWSRRPLGWVAWAACTAVVAGIGAFVALTSLSSLAGGQDLPRRAGLAAACLGISALPLAAAGLAAAGRRRTILLAVAAGLADACMAVVTMAFAHTIPHGLTAVVTSWPLYALIAAGFCSFLLTQTAYQAGCPMITLPVIAVVTPVSSLVAGAGLLGETPQLGGARAVGLGLAVLVTATGLVTLARRTVPPHAADPGSGSGSGGVGAGSGGGASSSARYGNPALSGADGEVNVPESARRSLIRGRPAAPLYPVVVTTTGINARGCDSHGVPRSPAYAGICAQNCRVQGTVLAAGGCFELDD